MDSRCRRDLYHRVDVQLAVLGRRRADADGAGGEFCGQRAAVGGGMSEHGFDSHGAGGGADAQQAGRDGRTCAQSYDGGRGGRWLRGGQRGDGPVAAMDPARPCDVRRARNMGAQTDRHGNRTAVIIVQCLPLVIITAKVGVVRAKALGAGFGQGGGDALGAVGQTVARAIRPPQGLQHRLARRSLAQRKEGATRGERRMST